jgi:ATP-dependent Clp protease ATP-binding subunit ClpA
LSRKNGADFASKFGSDATTRLDALLDQLPANAGIVTDAPEVDDLLARVAAAPDGAALLNDSIRHLLEGAAGTSSSPASRQATAGEPEPQIAAGKSALKAAPSGAPTPAPIDKAALLTGLRERIVGQDAALEIIVNRLALTRMQFDLRPSRPDGVFLLAGPSGTGKSALAEALADLLFGGEGHLISLDMSEYSHDWAVSRLIGPQPGYVGSDKPEGWLTTRVRRQPESLILLDEIEKSHPTVWNTFLQVFNDGRLTDGQGVAADFSRTVIMMTSNLGSESFRRKRPIGFHVDDDFVTEQSDRTLAAVKESMPPEFINRLDAIVVFSPLSPAVIHEIARREINMALARLRERGYDTDVPDVVVQFIADKSYDPAYGARYLQRTIERYLLQTLLNFQPSRLRAEVDGDEVGWVEVDPPA